MADDHIELTNDRQAFDAIYEKGGWGGGSGAGARYSNNIDYVSFVANFMARNDIKSVVDFGCGDWQFSRHMNWEGISYQGFDLVGSVIRTNQRAYARQNVVFTQFLDIEQLPQADLLLCKDVFQHLPNEHVISYLRRFKKLFRWLLITNDDFPVDGLNSNIKSGSWRAVRLDLPPFNEEGATLLSWIVISETPLVRKRTYLILGDPKKRSDCEVPFRPIARAPIPRRIFQTWKVRSPLPLNFEYWSDTIKAKNPSYEYVLWDDADNLAFIEKEFPWFTEKYKSYDVEIKRADCVRYFWLYFFGGFYLDLDVECLRKLDRYTYIADVILGRMGANASFAHSIPNAIMASKPRQEFWLFVMSELYDRPINGRPEAVTGPILLKNCVDSWFRESPAGREVLISRILKRLSPELQNAHRTAHVSLRPSREWYPLDWSDGMHQTFRQAVLQGQFMSSEEKKKYFPGAWLVTYWSHSW